MISYSDRSFSISERTNARFICVSISLRLNSLDSSMVSSMSLLSAFFWLSTVFTLKKICDYFRVNCVGNLHKLKANANFLEQFQMCFQFDSFGFHFLHQFFFLKLELLPRLVPGLCFDFCHLRINFFFQATQSYHMCLTFTKKKNNVIIKDLLFSLQIVVCNVR